MTTCPFIDAVEEDDQKRIDAMTADCAPDVKDQLMEWARQMIEGKTIEEILRP